MWLGAKDLEALLDDEILRRHVAMRLTAPLAGEPVRVVQSDDKGHLILMAASWQDLSLSVVKVLYERPDNKSRGKGKPVLNGTVSIYRDDGEVIAVADGAAFTGLRTAAIAALATQWLSVSHSCQCIIGAGFEAYYHAKALSCLPGVQTIRLWNRTPEAAYALQERLCSLPRFSHLSVTVHRAIEEALADADVITTVTSSPTPLLDVRMIKQPVLINAMGAYLPNTRELSSDIVAQATLYADFLPACLREAGDFLIPAGEGLVDLTKIRPLASAPHYGPEQGITVMKSVGSAVFDLACAECLVELIE
ncbi:ornithine cyclodeaminase family protein [Sulfobacillus thermosulfidooxidans]|uniref:ornithine cyclodeaminase family protein n=1 Tax=Sulfobacillus thermosulfidooxidans TaxID=28034 RepID=UPI0006B4041A|nr:ornithine cyclodeaminase family protein [Sulfobacillus thermosulfidooxidans]